MTKQHFATMKLAIDLRILTALLLILSGINGLGQIFSSETEGCAPLAGVDFGHSFGAVSGILWDFGDGSSATVNSPSHTFQDPGLYTVTFNADGGISEALSINVFAHPIADFIITSPISGCLPFTITLEDISSASAGAVLESWTWDFGDGGVLVGTNPNPTYTYTLIGINDNSLVVEDNNGCTGSVVMMNAITTSIPPTVDFITNPAVTSACNPPLLVDVNAIASSNSPVGSTIDIAWDLGNGTSSTQADPIGVTYQNYGTFPIVLDVTDDIGCVFTDTVDVFIGSPQAALDLIGGPSFCDIVTFLNTSDPAETFIEWGDGTEESFENGAPDTLIHVYEDPGTYTAILTTLTEGCENSSEVEVIIEEILPDFTSSPNFSCLDSLNVTYQSTTNDLLEYMWVFPGGQDTLYGPVAEYTHYSPGSEDPYYMEPLTLFGANLTVTSLSGCQESITIFQDSIITPYAGYYVYGHDGCAPVTITFNDSSEAITEIISWEWVFGDGDILVLDNNEDPIDHTYSNPGEYSPYLVITTFDGCTDTSFVIPIEVGEVIDPSISFDPVQVCPNEPVDFSAIDNPNVDFWNISTDGGQFTSCTPNADVTDGFSSNAGFHDVTITANYNGCLSETTITDAVEVLGPVGHFHIEVDCDAPFGINCIGNITGADSWTYDFGDGTIFNSAVDQDFYHTYADVGDYEVVLTSSSSSGCSDFVETITVHIRDVEAVVDNSAVSCQGAEFTLSAENSLGVDLAGAENYLWIFDQDLNVAPNWTQEPFTEAPLGSGGFFDILLVVQDINGCRDTVATSVFSSEIEASFEMDIESYCLPLGVQFNDLSTSDTTIVNWSWDFGNGTFSGLQSPLNIYDEGNYFEIVLIATNAIGCEDEYVLDVSPDIPDADFTLDEDSVCVGEVVVFNPDVPSYVMYDWSFEDGQTTTGDQPNVTFDEPGIFNATLVVTNSDGCTDESTFVNAVSVQAYPEVGFTSTVDDLEHICYPTLIEFTDTSLVTGFDYRDWNLGTGAPVVNATTVGTIYEEPGTYTVSLEVGTTFGCISDYSQEYLVEGPVGDFIMSEDEICIYGSVTLELADTTGVTAFLWDFGNGADSADVNPITYTYNELPSGGSTFLQLVMWSGDYTCSYTAQQPFTVHQTIADFDRNNELLMEDTIHCFGETDYFNNQSLAANSYVWNFGDQEFSSSANPSHTYDEGGTYDITLYASNSITGCSDTITKSITIYPEMVIGAEDGLACLGDTIQLEAFGGDEYLWSPPDIVSDASIPNPIIHDNQDHDLSVLVTDTNGCSEIHYLVADFIRSPPAQVWTDTLIDYGQLLDFEVPNQPYHLYDWADELGTICYTCGSSGFLPVNDHLYTLIISDLLGCYVDTFQFDVQVLAELPFFMPNSFSPNEDELNDHFFPVFERMLPDDYEFIIWNRNGEQVWKAEKLGDKWAGPPEGSNYYSENEVYMDSTNT